MKNERIVQITATQNDVYGLTETGKLVRLDANIGQFVLRAPEDILDMDRANILKGIPEINLPNPGRSNQVKPVKKKKLSLNFEYAVYILGSLFLGALFIWLLFR